MHCRRKGGARVALPPPWEPITYNTYNDIHLRILYILSIGMFPTGHKSKLKTFHQCSNTHPLFYGQALKHFNAEFLFRAIVKETNEFFTKYSIIPVGY